LAQAAYGGPRFKKKKKKKASHVIGVLPEVLPQSDFWVNLDIGLASLNQSMITLSIYLLQRLVISEALRVAPGCFVTSSIHSKSGGNG
jgi:hypothetical protein